MIQKEYKKLLKSKMTFKNFLVLLQIAKAAADEGFILNGIDVGDFLYLDMFKDMSDEFYDEFEKEDVL